MHHHSPDKQPFYAQRLYRLLTGVLGLSLSGAGLYALLWADTSGALRWLAGLGILVLGINMVVAACTAKESWISKIGPLP